MCRIFGIARAVLLCAAFLAVPAAALVDQDADLGDVAQQAPGVIAHCDAQVAAREFPAIFECGDLLFDTAFTAVDGVGGDVGNGKRFTRLPRYDLDGYLIQPVPRVTGPSAQTCAECHPGVALGGGGDGSGLAALNNIQDRNGPAGRGDPSGFLVRNPPHLFGVAAIQMIAEEMTAELQAVRSEAISQACSRRVPVSLPAVAKVISFGTIAVTPTGGADCAVMAQVDQTRVDGVDPDLVVRGFGLEGLVGDLRTFILGAFHNELGMEPIEFSGMGNDNDRDGVMDEIRVQDATAMTIYLSAQPIPTSELVLDQLRQDLSATPEGQAQLADGLGAFLPALSAADRDQIGRGEGLFESVGCARCHTPAMTISRKMFAEPSPLAAFRQPADRSPSGIDLVAAGVDPRNPLTYDITKDQPDNVFMVNGQERRLGSFETDQNGLAIARVFGDFKRHEMGPDLAEEADRISQSGNPIGRSTFITSELWGVGSTAPYLHDGRATTIEEAILEHGGEATPERDAFRALPQDDQADLLRFLNNLVLFVPDGGEDEAAAESPDAAAEMPAPMP